MKIPVTDSEIESAAFQHVAQCLDQMCQRVTHKLLCRNVEITYNLQSFVKVKPILHVFQNPFFRELHVCELFL